jgi:Zn-dependent peptidase ImmA (M78 family)
MQGSGIEAYCNRFAGLVLVPTTALRTDPDAKAIASGNVPADDQILDAITRRFHVSRGVIWYRLREVEFIAEAQFQEKWDEWADWFPSPTDARPRSTTAANVLRKYGVRFADLVLGASRSGAITRVDAAQNLVVPADKLPSIESAISERSRV